MIAAMALAVVLQMSNAAGAPAKTIAAAEAQVARMFHEIGVDVAWRSAADSGADNEVIRVVLIPYETRGLRQRRFPAMGAALRVSPRTRVAYVFFRQIEDEASRHVVSATLVLACAIAHELGHLLLPDDGHSASGLMRAVWDRDDFCRANQGQLRFLPEQAARIRGLATSAY